MKVVTEKDPISVDEIRRMAAAGFGDLVKAVIDMERRIMVVDAELHADEEAELLAGGSRRQDLWGIDLYQDLPEGEWLEFDSMINLRPSFGNRSRGVDDSAIRRWRNGPWRVHWSSSISRSTTRAIGVRSPVCARSAEPERSF